MSSADKIMSGGFLSGYKTYIAGGIAILGAIGAYLSGEAGLVETVQLAVTGLLGMTIRNGIAKEAAANTAPNATGNA